MEKLQPAAYIAGDNHFRLNVMITDLLLFVFGLLLLYAGAELLVQGASRLALLARISSLIVGVTVVAFGTSSPEFLVSIVAGWSGRSGVALGNIIGSNIANIGLIIGISVLLRPLELKNTYIGREVMWMFGATLFFWLAALDGSLTLWDGLVMLGGIVVFTVILIRQSMRERQVRKPEEPDIPGEPRWVRRYPDRVKAVIYLILVAGGITILIRGSEVTIDAATDLAAYLGVPQLIIGLSLVAFGTSLPELATALVSIFRHENELLIGNVIGSNIFNLLFVGGALAAGFHVPVSGEITLVHIPLMMLISLMILPGITGKKTLGRCWGGILTAVYVLFILLIYIY